MAGGSAAGRSSIGPICSRTCSSVNETPKSKLKSLSADDDPREAPAHPALVGLELLERRARDAEHRHVAGVEVRSTPSNVSAHRRAGRAARLVARPEHEVVDEQLRAPVEELRQRLRPVVGLEPVLLVDPDPRQLAALPGELVAASGCAPSRVAAAPRGPPAIPRGCRSCDPSSRLPPFSLLHAWRALVQDARLFGATPALPRTGTECDRRARQAARGAKVTTSRYVKASAAGSNPGSCVASGAPFCADRHGLRPGVPSSRVRSTWSSRPRGMRNRVVSPGCCHLAPKVRNIDEVTRNWGQLARVRDLSKPASRSTEKMRDASMRTTVRP